MKIRFAPFSIVCMLVVGDAPAQDQVAPPVPQAPPFTTIATLSGIPDWRAVRPTADPPLTDIRVAEWSPLRRGPAHFLRLVQTGDEITPMLLLWWFGSLGPAEPPLSSRRRCTVPAEEPRICIEPVSLDGVQDWSALARMLLTAPPCDAQRPTDGFELRVQVFESGPSRQYRESEICDPVAKQLREFLAPLAG